MTQAELTAYYAISLIEGIGAKRLMALRDFFGSAEKALVATKSQLQSIENFGKVLAEAFIAGREQATEKSQEHLGGLAADTRLITYYDEEYPSYLKSIYSPPAMLFVSGDVSLLNAERNIAIVGTRKMTDYGRRATEELCKELAENDVVVTSGFAKGVDTAAHKAIFDASGRTIAVLGTGIDRIYPEMNKSFAKKLIDSGRGTIISELPVGTPPDGKNFPVRNRIVSGMAKATIVIESEESGGSMITASLALDQNRDIFALPGDINRPTSRGPNQLIYESRAKLFRSASDILMELGWKESLRSEKERAAKKQKKRVDLTLFEQSTVSVLDAAGGPLHIDEIAERTGKEVHVLLVQLLELEFRDVVRQMAGKYFTTIF